MTQIIDIGNGIFYDRENHAFHRPDGVKPLEAPNLRFALDYLIGQEGVVTPHTATSLAYFKDRKTFLSPDQFRRGIINIRRQAGTNDIVRTDPKRGVIFGETMHIPVYGDGWEYELNSGEYSGDSQRTLHSKDWKTVMTLWQNRGQELLLDDLTVFVHWNSYRAKSFGGGFERLTERYREELIRYDTKEVLEVLDLFPGAIEIDGPYVAWVL